MWKKNISLNKSIKFHLSIILIGYQGYQSEFDLSGFRFDSQLLASVLNSSTNCSKVKSPKRIIDGKSAK